MVAVVLPGGMAAGNLDAAAVLLACAWCSDALDGRLARVSAGDTRLHGLDLVVDTAVVAPGFITGVATWDDVRVGARAPDRHVGAPWRAHSSDARPAGGGGVDGAGDTGWDRSPHGGTRRTWSSRRGDRRAGPDGSLIRRDWCAAPR